MTDQNPIENNPQENQPDNTAQGINLTPESVQMPEDNTVPLNPALSIEPLSASAAPSEENVQNTAGGIVLESAFEASEQPSVTQDFTPQNDISSDGISVSAVPHTDIPVLNPFDGMTGENSQNTEMTGIAQPEESALATDNSATAASSAPDAFADLYNVSGTQPSDTQAPSISPESEENTLMTYSLRFSRKLPQHLLMLSLIFIQMPVFPVLQQPRTMNRLLRFLNFSLLLKCLPIQKQTIQLLLKELPFLKHSHLITDFLLMGRNHL